MIGATLAQAFLMWLVNRACEIQLASQSMGPVVEIPVPVLEKCVAGLRSTSIRASVPVVRTPWLP